MLSRWARWHGKRKFLLFYCICRTLCQEQNNERSWGKKTLSFFSWMKTPTPHTLRSIWLVVNDWMISNNEIQGKNKNSKSVFVFHLPGECSYQMTEIPFHFFFSFFRRISKPNWEQNCQYEESLSMWRSLLVIVILYLGAVGSHQAFAGITSTEQIGRAFLETSAKHKKKISCSHNH